MNRIKSITLLLAGIMLLTSSVAFAAAGDATAKVITVSSHAGSGKLANASDEGVIEFNGTWPGDNYTAISYGLVPEGTTLDYATLNGSAFIYLGSEPGFGTGTYRYFYPKLKDVSPKIAVGQYRVVVFVDGGEGEEVFFSEAPITVVEGNGLVYQMDATTLTITSGGIINEEGNTTLKLHLDLGNIVPVTILPSDVLHLYIHYGQLPGVDFNGAEVVSPEGVSILPAAGMQPNPFIMLGFSGSKTILSTGIDIVIGGITALEESTEAIIKFLREPNENNPDVIPASLGFWTGTLTFQSPNYQFTTLTSPTGVSVSGNFTTGSTLTATAINSNAACQSIIDADNDGKLISLYDLSVSGGYTGQLTVNLPVDAVHNGKPVSIIHCAGNTTESVDAIVTDGKASGLFTSLSPFGVVLTQSGDGNFQIGDTFYDNLEDAIAAVPDGGVIKMMKDITIFNDIFFDRNISYTFDLNGHRVTGAGAGLGTLEIDDGDVTIKNGSIVADFTDGVAVWVMGGNATLDALTVTATVGNNAASAVYVEGGTLSILSGDYTGYDIAVYCYGGKTTLVSGHFVSTRSSCLYIDSSGSIVLATGSVTDVTNWLNSAHNVTVTAYVAPSGLLVDGTAIIFSDDNNGTGWSYTASSRTLTITGNVTVTGAVSGQTETLTVDIAAGKTVNWKASYSGHGSGLATNEATLYFPGSGNVIFSDCSIQGNGYGISVIYSEGDITINADANIIYTDDDAHVVKTTGDIVMNGGYVSATGHSNALGADGDLIIHGGFVEANWLALQGGSGAVIIDGGYVYGQEIAIIPWGNTVTLSGGAVQCGSATAIESYITTTVTVSGGLLLVNGTSIAEVYKIQPSTNGTIQRTGSGIIGAFDRSQTGPFVEGTHTALVSEPVDALTWTTKDGHGGVSYGNDMFLDLGVTVSSLVPAGSGTAGDPYRIYTPKELKWLATEVNAGNATYNAAYYKLMNDLDLSDYGSGYDNGKGWKPIGNNDTDDHSTCFFGTFDGNSKVVTGLYINRSDENFIGLFGYLKDGEIKNVGIENENVTGKNCVGGVVGEVIGGTIENCYASGVVHSDGTGACGGIVGLVYTYGTVKNCYATATVSGVGFTGGVVGSIVSGELINCYATGAVSGTGEWFGGVAGKSIFSTVTNCAALNPSITGADVVCRVVPDNYGSTFSGNIAFDGMTDPGAGKFDEIANDDTDPNGLSTSKAALQAITGFPAGFDAAPWTYIPGMLPGLFGQTVEMPVHLQLGGLTPSGLLVDGEDLSFDSDNSGTGWSYVASTRTLTITGDVTVTGAVTGQTETLTVDIATGKTVTWKANYSGAMTGTNLLDFTGAGGNLVLSDCNIQASGNNLSVVYSYGNITIETGANIVYNELQGHAVKAEGNVVMNDGYITTMAGANALASDGDMIIHGGFIDASWLALSVYTGEILIDGGYIYGGTNAIWSFGTNITLSGGIVLCGTETAILSYNSNTNVTVSGGLLLVNGTSLANIYKINPSSYGTIQRTGDGIIGAFDRSQTGPFVEGTHTALVSDPTDTLTWAIRDGHGGVSFGVNKFLDLGVTVNPSPATSYAISIGTFTGGSVSTDKVSAEAGETVTLTISPATDYRLNTVWVYKTGDEATSVNLSGSDATRTFIMPAYDVTVEATFDAVVHAQTPVIVLQLPDITVNEGDEACIWVTASVEDGGTISYQWYCNVQNSNIGGTAIDGATRCVYSPPTTPVGVMCYYVVITNTNNNVNGMKTATLTSDPIAVTVIPKDNTGFENEAKSALYASSTDGGLLVKGLVTGESFGVYNMHGQTVYFGKASNTEELVKITIKGIYIVKSGREVVKVVY